MMVVDLAVEDHDRLAGRIDHRLRGGVAEIEDRQSPMAEERAVAVPDALAVGTAMCDRGERRIGVHGFAGREESGAKDPTHQRASTARRAASANRAAELTAEKPSSTVRRPAAPSPRRSSDDAARESIAARPSSALAPNHP